MPLGKSEESREKEGQGEVAFPPERLTQRCAHLSLRAMAEPPKGKNWEHHSEQLKKEKSSLLAPLCINAFKGINKGTTW